MYIAKELCGLYIDSLDVCNRTFKVPTDITINVY